MNESRSMMETLKNFSKMTNRKLKSSFRREKFLATYFRGNVSSQRKTTGLAQKTEKGKWILDCRGKCENYRHLL